MTDIMAQEAFRTIVADSIADSYDDTDRVDRPFAADNVIDKFGEVEWEHGTNEQGVPVRRLVVKGEWLVDLFTVEANARAATPAPVRAVSKVHAAAIRDAYPGADVLVQAEPATERHAFVHVTYKGRYQLECGHVTMVSTHEGRMCNGRESDPIHS